MYVYTLICHLEFSQYKLVQSTAKLTLEQMPQPIHNGSEIEAIFDSGVTSIHSFPVEKKEYSAEFLAKNVWIQEQTENEKVHIKTSIHIPIRTTGQDFLHSCLHLFGLHLSVLTIAIRVSLSCVSWFRWPRAAMPVYNVYKTKNKISTTSPENQDGFCSHVSLKNARAMCNWLPVKIVQFPREMLWLV